MSDRLPDYPFPADYLKKVAQTRMPFGRYQGRVLTDLPEPYLLWFQREGFPQGRLGELMALALELKVNGLERLVAPWRESQSDAN